MVGDVQNRIKIFSAVQPPSHAPVPLAELQAFASLSGRLPAFSKLTLHGSEQDKHARACAVVFLQSAYQKVVEHLAQDTTREHGGFLLGYESLLDPGVPAVVVTDAIAGRHTEGTPVRLTFTNDTWRDFEDEVMRRYPDNERVPQRLGWYHSHPNISIFLSHYDLDVCKTFEKRRYPVALVVDPVQNRGGFFIGEAKGYHAHSPQDFYEAHDHAEESVVTWCNLRRPDAGRTQSDLPKPIVENQKSENVFKIVPQGEKMSRATRVREIRLVTVLAVMATAIGYLVIKERHDARVIETLLTEVSSLKTSSATGRSVVGPLSPTVTITPEKAELSASGQLQFHADVKGTDDNAVGWDRKPREGTISSAGLYTAPKRVKSETEVTVLATSAADPTKVAIARVRLMPPKPAVSVKVTPKTVQLRSSQRQQFHARVSGVSDNNENSFVEWTLDPKGQGTVNTGGLYNAPSTIPSQITVTLTATSLADDAKSDRSTIVLLPDPKPESGDHAPNGASPEKETPSDSTPDQAPLEIKVDKTDVGEGDSLALTATVAGEVDSEVTWSTEPLGVGSISQDGRYTAPKTFQPEHSTVTVIATSKKDAKRIAKNVLTITAQGGPANNPIR
jgi:proteasome lid subunit RPN8/RPN11